MKCRSLFALLLGLSGVPHVTVADTWVVPDQFVTIQQAIDASSDADTVLVRAGTYLENLLVVDKALALRSLDGPEVTIIDGAFPPRSDTLSVICALNSDPRALMIEGFTIRNGPGGSTFPGLEPGAGGGIILVQTIGRVERCLVESNFADGPGGGIFAFSSSLELVASEIRNNQGRSGGALEAAFSSLVLMSTTIEGNQAASAGILATFGPLEISDCVLRGNRQASDGFLITSGSGVIVMDLLAFENGDDGGGYGLITAAGQIESSTFVQNDCNVTVALRSGMLTNSIVAYNTGRGVSCDPDVQLRCNDVFGNAEDGLCGVDLGGNVNLDPLFCADYSLAESSPCAPANAPAGCGLIGARDVGCAGAVEPSTWGRIKAEYR